MPESPDLAALACEDCPAEVNCGLGQGIAGPVLVVSVTHAPTCPWLARVAPGGVTKATRFGILMHYPREDDTDAERGA